MKNVVLLGSTGSIGLSTLQVVADLPDRLRPVGLAANESLDVLAEQVHKVKPKAVALANAGKCELLKGKVGSHTKVYCGDDCLEKLATMPEADIVLVAIVGTAGLRPALAAIRAGKDLAVASKEILVMAGEIVMREAEKHKVKVLPVDSEHNAIYQCIEGRNPAEVRRIILTASGGPFRKHSREDLHKVGLDDALKHPTWSMGKKITIDSATLFNKGLEMIEAHWLFGTGMDKVDVVIHPQSIIHSMVEFVDGSTLAQLSMPSMRYPIQYALTYPDRLPNSMERTNFPKIGQLTFETPDIDKFPALRLAREAGTRGGTLPAVMNAANEVAVARFMKHKLKFVRIWDVVEKTMRAHKVVERPSLEAILAADAWARSEAERLCEA
jgi:1-deoxy-D-xylulose-5-phosphate reductoisomerase